MAKHRPTPSLEHGLKQQLLTRHHQLAFPRDRECKLQLPNCALLPGRQTGILPPTRPPRSSRYVAYYSNGIPTTSSVPGLLTDKVCPRNQVRFCVTPAAGVEQLPVWCNNIPWQTRRERGEREKDMEETGIASLLFLFAAPLSFVC